ncbi:pyruvate dehydrogenase complex dihydrolipoamide acetyltransferase [Oceanobacter sp. RED65]|uniref:Acetyltransferase component of pyruvate dehydrogenase complex n=2 Tax=Bermanella marisrubri TaxID=207949 RepID=Q1MZR2_9GAMM|nr:pyruvate dehydrogenase complex dihydrolipoamide acetyltransferase [Oceanobacter sp. RED65] [Bermanella marisrubri]
MNMAQVNVTVPDLGGIEEVEVIEISVGKGDSVDADDSIVVLESDKATMEVPAPSAGTIAEISVSVGDKVSTGSQVAVMDSDSADAGEKNPSPEQKDADEPKPQQVDQQAQTESKQESSSSSAEPQEIEVRVPDLGGIDEVEVIEIPVSKGDQLQQDDSILVLESDKATMEVPAPQEGELVSIEVKVGDKVSQDTLVAKMKVVGSSGSPTDSSSKAKTQEPAEKTSSPSQATQKSAPAKASPEPQQTQTTSGKVHAGPAVRKLAREFGVDLTDVSATGPKGRILKEDVQAFVKQRVKQPAVASGGPMGVVGSNEDFSKFGPITEQPLNKIKQATARNMVKSWSEIPQVTQFDQADITELEAYRKGKMQSMLPEGVRVSPLAFIARACVKALQAYPTFNSSLKGQGESLVLKQYYNIGIAVDTPEGLLVPVIKDADKKGIVELAQDSSELAKKARDKKLPMDAMQGGCFTISSLGGIGGTSFTPIVTAPQVAILGVSKAKMEPVWNGEEFEPRLMLPLSLSYDHRVIDGAEAARFTRYLCELLTDVRHLLL